jgi:DNA-binding transcriptional MerR regulator
MSKLIELLTNPANLKINNKSIKPTQNFILQLLKDSEPKKAVELLKNLHLTNDEIKEIISKLPEKKQKLYFEVLKNIFTQEIKLTQKKDNKIQKNNNLQNNIENLLKLTKQKNDKIQTIDLPQVNDNKDNNRQLTSKDLSLIHISEPTRPY